MNMESKYNLYLSGYRDTFKNATYRQLSRFKGIERVVYKLGFHHAKTGIQFSKQNFEQWLSKNLMS